MKKAAPPDALHEEKLSEGGMVKWLQGGGMLRYEEGLLVESSSEQAPLAFQRWRGGVHGCPRGS